MPAPPSDISAGFIVTRLIPRPDWKDRARILPSRVLSISECLSPSVPPRFEPECGHAAITDLLVSECSLQPAAATRIARLLLDQRARGEYEWPGVLASRDIAVELVSLLSPGEGWFAVEVAVAREDAQMIAAEAEAPRGLFWLLHRMSPSDARLFTLGYEIVGDDMGSLHSWFCNGLEQVALVRLGVRPGRLGLLQSIRDARAVTELLNAEELGEPVDWVACRLSVDGEIASAILADAVD